MTLTPDLEGACAFLRLLYPDRRRVLVAINPLSEKGREEIAARTLEPGDDAGVKKFVTTAFGKKWNVYYTVNQTVGPVTKKPKRSDIAEICYLHVDVDPRKPDADEREDMPAFLARERERILALLSNPPGGIPAPTCIVHSGGGYNALWKLDKPLVITGETDKDRIKSAEEWKHYNRQLERAFGADNCHNIDRVLRLPGTVNFPNHVKIKAGRTEPTLAALGSWDESLVYSITQFTPAPLTREQTSGAPPKLKIPAGALRRVKDVEELDLSKIPRTADLVRRVIVEGKDAQDPTRFCDDNGKFDRSRAVYFVGCQLAKAGIEQDQIYAILTDPKFGISESILEKGSSMERHALRAVERGQEAAESDELAELNDRHAVISSVGGHCVVVQEDRDPTGRVGRSRLTISEFADIVKRYGHRQIQIGTKIKRGGVEEPVFQKLGQWWLDNPRRRQFEGVIFAPGREVDNYYNLWQGFAVEAIEGDCSLFLDHLLTVVCDGRQDYYDYLLNWMAYAVQYPDDPAEVAVVFRGEPGTGKGVVAREFGKLFGRHYLQITNSNHLVGQFNDHLRDCVFLFLDEAFFAGDVKHKSILKNLVTEPEIMIERKGVDAILSRNHLHVMMASNERWVVPADPKERRYFVLDVPSHRRGVAHKDYWNALYAQMDRGGREALLYLLKTRDLTGFAPREYPETKALADQKMQSMTSLQEWWYAKLQAGQVTPTHVRWTAPVICERLQSEYLLYAGKLRGRVAMATELGRFLAKMCPGLRVRKETIQEVGPGGTQYRARHRVYLFPDLGECRAAWDEEFGFKSDWPEVDDDPDEMPPGGF